jgi:tetratricopeptide (TPR) repeat protein
MAAINADSKMLEDAVKYQLRILDIQYATLSFDHIDIAFNLYMLGGYYEEMGNPSEALRCYNQSLSIYQANYSSDHKKVKEVEAMITKLKKLK